MVLLLERLELDVAGDGVELRVVEDVEGVDAERQTAPAAEPEALLHRQVDVVDRRAIQVVAARLESEAAHRRLRVEAERHLLVRVAHVVARTRIPGDDRPIGVLRVRSGDVGLRADAVDAPGQAVGEAALEAVAARDLPVVDEARHERIHALVLRQLVDPVEVEDVAAIEGRGPVVGLAIVLIRTREVRVQVLRVEGLAERVVGVQEEAVGKAAIDLRLQPVVVRVGVIQTKVDVAVALVGPQEVGVVGVLAGQRARRQRRVLVLGQEPRAVRAPR